MKIKHKQTIKEFIEAMNAFKVDVALAMFAPKAIIDDVSVGKKFKNLSGVTDYLQTYFVGYNTFTKLESTTSPGKNEVLAQVDFTGDFGHETGGLHFKFDDDGLIIFIAAHLD